MAATVKHPSHACMLVASYPQNPYVCNGCREKGTGLSYRCHACDFYLHSCCALNSDASPLRMHSLHNEDGHYLQFLINSSPHFCPPCNACGKPAQGFAYHCVYDSCGYVVHPCCGLLPPIIRMPSVDASTQSEMEIVLSLSAYLRGHCGYCGSSTPSWAFVAPSQDYSVHIGCVREMLLEMAESSQATTSTAGQYLQLQRVPGPQASAPFMAAQHLPLQRLHTRSRTGCRLFFKLTKVLIKGILGALFGDPTSLIVGVITSFTN